MSLLLQLPRLFSDGPKRLCTKCSKVKPMNHFAHGKEYANKYCRECEGRDAHEDMPTGTGKVPHSYMLTLSTFLPKSRSVAERYLKMARYNTFVLLESSCHKCGSEEDELTYAYEDKTATKPYSIFAPNGKFKNAYFFCNACAEEMFAKRSKPGGVRRTSSKTRKLVLAEKDSPQKERDTSAKPPAENNDSSDVLRDGERQCQTCAKYYPIEEFNKNYTELDRARNRKQVNYADCKSCRSNKRKDYTKKYSKYVKDIRSQKYDKIREYVTNDLKSHPCPECKMYHNVNNPLKYYDPETLELLSTESQPYMRLDVLRLHSSCLRDLKKLRLL